MMTGLIKGVGVTELNSNIGCFEMMFSERQGINRLKLNSNIGCFEMKLTTM